MSTRHDVEKYAKFAEALQASIREQFPIVQVFVKPSATDLDQKVKRLSTKQKEGGNNDMPTIIDGQLKPSRLGAFEVQMYCKHSQMIIQEVIHSKLKTRRWPTIALVLHKIYQKLPRIRAVNVKLFHENHPHLLLQEEGDLDPKSFNDIKVKIKSNYNNAMSQ